MEKDGKGKGYNKNGIIDFEIKNGIYYYYN